MHVNFFYILMLAIFAVSFGVAFSEISFYRPLLHRAASVVAVVAACVIFAVLLSYPYLAEYVRVADDTKPAATQIHDLAEVDGYYLVQSAESLSFSFIDEDGTLQMMSAKLGEDVVSIDYVGGNNDPATVEVKTGYVMEKMWFLYGDKEEYGIYRFEIPGGSIKIGDIE